MEDKFKNLRWTIGLGILVIVAIIAIIIILISSNSKINEIQAAHDKMLLDNEQLQLSLEQSQLANEYQMLNQEFAQYEDQSQLIANDSLAEKYLAAKSKVEKLMQELNSEKTKSAQRIKELQNEIETLKGILRHYVAQIDSLGKENAALREENIEVKNENTQLRTEKENISRERTVLQEKMTLAEKLNVTGVTLKGLKKNGKDEKNVTKMHQLVVTFTIPQNNSTPVGKKTIYLRITSPEGQLLGNAGTFSFEGSSVPCTAKKDIEYEGQEIAGIPIYWDVTGTLTPGDYTVELFTDGYRLASKHFTLKK